MRNPVSVLRTTTAIVISLSLAGTHAFAANAGTDAFKLAQNTEAQPEPSAEAETLPLPVEEAEQATDPQGAAEVQEGDVPIVEGDAATPAESEPGSADPAAAQADPGTPEVTEAQETAEPQPDEPVSSEQAEAGSTDGDAGEMTQTEVAPSAGETADQPATEAAPAAEAQPAAPQTTAAEAEPAATEEAPEQSGTAETAEEPATLQATEAQSESDMAPAAEAQVTETQQPSAEQQATDAQQPMVEQQATETQQPTAEQQATDTQQATDAQQPTVEQQATETQQPTAEQQSTETQQPAAEQQATETQQPVAEQQATETQQPAAEQQATETQEPSAEQQAVEGQPADAQQADAQEPAETVGQVSEEQIEEVTSAGEDVVIENETTPEEIQAELQDQLQELREQQVDLEQRLQDAEPVEVQEEVVTEETARAATEDFDSDDDDNDDNEIWKYLGAAAAGAAVGAIVPALGGRLVQDEGDRVIVERGGEFFVRSDENVLLRQPGATVQTEEFPSGITRSTVLREDGSRIVTVRNAGGFILRRTRITPDGQEVVLLAQTPEEVYAFGEWDDLVPQATAHESVDVDYGRADRDDLRQALVAEPVWEPEEAFPLQAVRESVRVRELVPAVNLPINFATGSAAIRPSEIEELTALGRMMEEIIEENPREIFLVEGHTDAVGSNLLNLALSDRRAESVALALAEYFDIPPENLVVQGYGERYLKVETSGASAENRRATVRRITPLIDQVASR